LYEIKVLNVSSFILASPYGVAGKVSGDDIDIVFYGRRKI